MVDTEPATSTSAAPSTATAATTPPTTTGTCPVQTIPTTPVTGPATTVASLLTNVQEAGDACVDRVAFDFTAKGTTPPGYTLTYGTPPFSDSGSGAPVSVAGNAFVVVTIKPGYGYDFEAGKPTYTGPRSLRIARANHVRAVVETGDYEGVLTWVIGLDSKRPFQVEATGAPRHQLIVAIS
jgi:hypothetical protein